MDTSKTYQALSEPVRLRLELTAEFVTDMTPQEILEDILQFFFMETGTKLQVSFSEATGEFNDKDLIWYRHPVDGWVARVDETRSLHYDTP
jgi:acetyl/propionyl-CoA carboxylase alpha subunit